MAEDGKGEGTEAGNPEGAKAIGKDDAPWWTKFRLPLALTALYLGVGGIAGYWLIDHGKWLASSTPAVSTPTGGLEPNQFGDLLAGAFAPLAFLWLVWGYLLQRHELELQRKELSGSRTALVEQGNQQKAFAEAMQLQVVFELKDSIDANLLQTAREFSFLLNRSMADIHFEKAEFAWVCSPDELFGRLFHIMDRVIQSKRDVLNGNSSDAGRKYMSETKDRLDESARKYMLLYEVLRNHCKLIKDEYTKRDIIELVTNSNFSKLNDKFDEFVNPNSKTS